MKSDYFNSYGITVGLDLYGSKTRLWEVDIWEPSGDVWTDPKSRTGHCVWYPYGGDWTQLTLDFIVPDWLFTHDDWYSDIPD